MTLYERINQDMIAAWKQSDKVKANLLRTLLGSIQTKEKNFNPERKLSDAEIINEISKMLSGVREIIKLLEIKPFNIEQLNLAKREEDILNSYIPAQLTDDELLKIINGYKELGYDLKTIMTNLKSNYPGQYDGKKASELAKR